MQFHTLFQLATQGSSPQTRSCVIRASGKRGLQERLSNAKRKGTIFYFFRPNLLYLNGETNRRCRRDPPCKEAKRWPRNNSIATASGGVSSSPIYQLIEEGIPA
jgi:hypothetical protein